MEMLIMPGHYGDKKKGKKPTGQLKLNMQKMPPEVQKRLLKAMQKKKKKPTRYNPYGQGSSMNPTKASYTTGP